MIRRSTHLRVGPLSLVKHSKSVLVLACVVASATLMTSVPVGALPPPAPVITLQPTDQTAASGQTVTFSAAAMFASTVQWQLSVDGGSTWFDVVGLTSPSFTSGPVSDFENGWEVRATFTNGAGKSTTNAARFTFKGAPLISVQPASQIIASGEKATFSATASGTPTLTVQWQASVNGGSTWINATGLTTPTITVGPLTAFENGWEVRAIFRNALGTATTKAATITITSYGFDEPTGMAFDGSHLWVTNGIEDTVTEVNANDGSLVQTLSGGSYGFAGVSDIVFDGLHLWITNGSGDSVTEVNASNGSWVQTLSGGSYGFNGPNKLAFDGTHLWVGNQEHGAGGSVTEINASNGSWVRTLSGGFYGFENVQGITSAGTHIWVANTNDSVTEINAGDGSWIQTLSGGSFGFSVPTAIAFDGTHLWVANVYDPSVTEINASDGSWVQTLSVAPTTSAIRIPSWSQTIAFGCRITRSPR